MEGLSPGGGVLTLAYAVRMYGSGFLDDAVPFLGKKAPPGGTK